MIDQDVRLRGAQTIFVAQAVSDTASGDAGAFPRFDIGVAVADHERASGRQMKLSQGPEQKRRMRFFLHDTVAPEDRIEAAFHSQAPDNRQSKSVDLVAHHHAAFGAEMIEGVPNSGIKRGPIQQVLFVMFEENAHGVMPGIGGSLGQRVLEQMFHAASDVDVHHGRGQRRKIEMGTGKIDGLGEIVPCVREGSVEVKHDQINRFFHPIPIEIENTVEVNALNEGLFALYGANVVP